MEIKNDDRMRLLTERPEKAIASGKAPSFSAPKLGKRSSQPVIGMVRIAGDGLLDDLPEGQEQLDVGVTRVLDITELLL